jgi:hypothetical protein
MLKVEVEGAMDTYPNIWNFWNRGTKYGLLLGAVLGALFGTAMVPILGTLAGLMLGCVVGTPLGTLGGTLIAWLTWLLYPRLSHALYRLVVTLCSGLFSGVGAFLAFRQLFTSGSNFPSDGTPVFVGIPAMIAALAGLWAADRIASWYMRVVTPPA